jgi:hypothetical protein
MPRHAVFGSEHPSKAEKQRGMLHRRSDDHGGAGTDDSITHVHIVDVSEDDYRDASRLSAGADAAAQLQRLQYRFPQVHQDQIRRRFIRFVNRRFRSLRGDHVVTRFLEVFPKPNQLLVCAIREEYQHLIHLEVEDC